MEQHSIERSDLERALGLARGEVKNIDVVHLEGHRVVYPLAEATRIPWPVKRARLVLASGKMLSITGKSRALPPSGRAAGSPT